MSSESSQPHAPTDPTRRFANRVEFYLRARPRYPAAILRFFQTDLGLSPMHVMADVGSGTGFLAQPFLANGNVVHGIEPNLQMRKAAEELLADWPNFRSTDGRAEATTLNDASVQFVIAGQAFHWFEPVATRKEFQRILAPGGIVALVWNQRRIEESKFTIGYQELARRFGMDSDRVRSKGGTAIDAKILADFFGPGGYKTATFDNPQTLDLQGLKDRMTSSSYAPPPEHPRHGEMIAAIEKLFADHHRHGGVVIAHDTHVYCGKFA